MTLKNFVFYGKLGWEPGGWYENGRFAIFDPT